MSALQSGMPTAVEGQSMGYLRGMNAFGFNTMVTAKDESVPFNPMWYRERFQFQPTRSEHGDSSPQRRSVPMSPNTPSLPGANDDWVQLEGGDMKKIGRLHLGGNALMRPDM